MEKKNKGDKFLNVLMIILAIATAIAYVYHKYVIKSLNEEKIRNKMESIQEIYDSIPTYEDIINIYQEGE